MGDRYKKKSRLHIALKGQVVSCSTENSILCLYKKITVALYAKSCKFMIILNIFLHEDATETDIKYVQTKGLAQYNLSTAAFSRSYWR